VSRLVKKSASELKKKEGTTARTVFGSKVPLRIKVLLVVVLIAIMLISFALGRFPVTPADLIMGIYNHFFNPDLVASSLDAGRVDRVIFEIRLPRILLVMFSGAGLAVAGASLQGTFRNPLVSPDLLGASAGASLGVCAAILLQFPIWAIFIAAFVGGLAAVGLALVLNRAVRYDPVLGLVLCGILVSMLFQAGMALVKFSADTAGQLPAITLLLMGSFSSVNSRDLLWSIIPLACGFILLFLQRWHLNVLSFGDEEARAMGVNTRRVRLIVIFASTLLTAVSVAVAGIIGWVGLVIPHLARAIVGPNYKVLLPASAFIGATYLLIIDDIARLAMTIEIPIGILTAFIGVPVFLLIFRYSIKGWT